MDLQSRDLCAQAITNALAVSEQPDFHRFNIDGLRVRLDYIIQQWALFCTRHTELMLKHPMQQQVYKALYNEIEQSYLSATVNFSVRIRELQNEQDQNNDLDDVFSEQDVSVHSQETPNDEHTHDPIDGGNVRNYINHPNRIHANEQGAMSEPRVQLQPIYISCGSKKSIENTWGTFDGDLTRWQSFYDGFKASVHDEKDIPNAQKFQLLQSSLRGKAAYALAGWQLTDDNYVEAFERLQELYSLQYQTSHELLRKFNNLLPLERASGSMLQKMSNITHEVTRQLRAMKYPVQHYDLIFVHGLHDKLDPETRKQWELYRTSESPALAEMLKFLDWQAKALSGAQSNETKEQRENRKRAAPNSESFNGAKRPKHERSKLRAPEKKQELSPCVLCKGKHGLHRCANFIKMSLAERLKVIKEKKLCHNCLRATHFSRDCPLNECYRCNRKHNSLLCNENPKNHTVAVVQHKVAEYKPKQTKSA